MRMSVILSMVVLIATVISVNCQVCNAERVEIIPYANITVNGAKITSPTVLDIDLPSELIIQWDLNGIEGMIQGIIDKRSFSILRFEVKSPLKSDVKVCDVRISQLTVRVVIEGIPKLDEVVALIEGKNATIFYDHDKRSLTICGEHSTLPATIEIYGKMGGQPFLNMSLKARDGGLVEVKDLAMAAPRPISMKLIISEVISVIPLTLKPLQMEEEAVSSYVSGYQLVGRPLGQEGVLLKLSVVDERDMPLRANLKLMNGMNLSLMVNGSETLVIPKQARIKLMIEAEGFRPWERTIEATSDMEMVVRLEKKSLLEELPSIIGSIAHQILSNPWLLLMLIIGLIVIILIIMRRSSS